jgi:hypothetical protein
VTAPATALPVGCHPELYARVQDAALVEIVRKGPRK